MAWPDVDWAHRLVDSPGMRSDDHDFIHRQPNCLATLHAYWDAHRQMKQESKESDGWVGRLTSVPQVPPEALSGIHGKLIAFGYLKFELTAKDATLRYQLTPLGRTAVTGESGPEAGEAADPDWALSA